MKFLRSLLRVTVAGALGLLVGIGWHAARSTANVNVSSSAASPEGPADPSVKGVSAPRSPDGLHLLHISPLPTSVARNVAYSDRITRWLHWLEAIENTPLSDFPRLAESANGDATATRLLASRWVELDLRHLFSTLNSPQISRTLPIDELANLLFHEWVRRDPDGAMGALQGTNNLGTRERWRFNVAGQLMETDPERGLRALSEWGIDNFAPLMTGVAKWAAQDFRHATEVVLACPAGYTSQLAIDIIARVWAKADPKEALEFVAAKPGRLADVLAGTVLKTWAARELNQAADWLAHADENTRDRLSWAFVETWVRTDPTNALRWCESNLEGRRLATTLGNVADHAAQWNVEAAAEFVGSMTPSPARAEAAASVAKHWFPAWRSGLPVPAAAIAWMKRLDPASARRALEQVQWKWSNGDAKSMAEYVASCQVEAVLPSADRNVARSLARKDPVEAFAWASRLPAQRGLTAGWQAFAEWRQSQPELATKWFNALSSTDPRREFFLRQKSPPSVD